LTFRELQVLTLIADGKATKQAAAVLAISVRTAECHRAHIMDNFTSRHRRSCALRYSAGLIVA
jgi:FixJ family two-component response regulator